MNIYGSEVEAQSTSVVPDFFNADPNPAFSVMQIRVLMTKNWKQINAEKKL
jgi:hypothetical protein